MSAYISVYIRAIGGGPYIELDSWCRSSTFFELFRTQVNYGQTQPLTAEMLDKVIADASARIELYKDDIKNSQERIEFLYRLSARSVDTLDAIMERRQDEVNAIEEVKEQIDSLEHAIATCRVIYSILLNAETSSEGGDLFISYEDDPNFSANEKENA